MPDEWLGGHLHVVVADPLQRFLRILLIKCLIAIFWREEVVEGHLVGEHRVEKYHAGDLAGVGVGEEVGDEAAERGAEQHVRGLDLGGGEQVVQVGQDVTGFLDVIDGVAVAEVAPVVDADADVVGELSLDRQAVGVWIDRVKDGAVQVDDRWRARALAVEVETMAPDVEQSVDLVGGGGSVVAIVGLDTAATSRNECA